jgi:hypothetical protein
VYCYEPTSHALRQVVAGDLRGKLQAAAHDQPYVGSAPLCLVINMDVERTASSYSNRAERYCLLEAGHVSQLERTTRPRTRKIAERASQVVA